MLAVKWFGPCFALLCCTRSIVLSADKLEWTRIFPAGGQVGTTIEVEATGKFPIWPVQIWSDTEGIRWTCKKEAGKLEATVDSSVTVGQHWVRLFTEDGSTSVRPFVVGTSPPMPEKEPNDRTNEANRIDAFPLAIHGILEKTGDVDLFEVTLKAGQRVIVTVDAEKLFQSAVDVNLQILDSQGFVLVENLDHIGLDPYLEFVAPRDGKYIVRVFGFPATPDSGIGFAGRIDWLYRLRLETKAGSFGNPIACPMPTELDAKSIRLKPSKATNQEQAMSLHLPARVRSIITAPNQTHYFRFKAEAGAHYYIRAYAREYGSPLDATIAVLESTGKQLKQIDDIANNRDPELYWDAPKDGDYFVTIADFHRLGGKSYEYLLVAEEQNADYQLSIANDWIQSKIGDEAEIKVKINRMNKFKDTIQIEVDELPEGVKCEKVESKSEGDSSKSVTLKLKGTQPYQGPVRIIGRNLNSPEEVRVATAENKKPIWLSIGPK